MSGNSDDAQLLRTVRQTKKDTLLLVEYVLESPPKPTSSVPNSITYTPRNYWALLRQYARLERTLKQLQSLKDKGIITDEILRETMKQAVFLEDNRDKITQSQGYVVASADRLFFGDTHDEAVRKAREAVGERPYYSESIGLIDFPSPFHEGN